MQAQEVRPPSPWAVICPRHGKVYLLRSEFEEHPFVGAWHCPVCGKFAKWDEDNEVAE